MRIIAGSKRRLILETPAGMSTRPTQDRIKETLFNMIGPDVYDASFLDLFSGSGQMGIEALSRGASEAVFVENDPNAYKVIEKNLQKAQFEDKALLIKNDVFLAIKQLAGHKSFDYIFMDPPYNNLIEKNVIFELKNYNYVDENTLIIVEASLETDFSYLNEAAFEIIKQKCYKTNQHLFIKRKI